jgi:hypothetical protein
MTTIGTSWGPSFVCNGAVLEQPEIASIFGIFAKSTTHRVGAVGTAPVRSTKTNSPKTTDTYPEMCITRKKTSNLFCFVRRPTRCNSSLEIIPSPYGLFSLSLIDLPSVCPMKCRTTSANIPWAFSWSTTSSMSNVDGSSNGRYSVFNRFVYMYEINPVPTILPSPSMVVSLAHIYIYIYISTNHRCDGRIHTYTPDAREEEWDR